MTAVDGGPQLVHQAFAYDSPEQFVSAMVPFLCGGLDRGDQVLAVTSASNTGALREALGTDAADVDFRDAEEWYRQPYRTLHAYERYVDEHADGRIVRVLGEPVWERRSPASVREWTRYESVLNAAFASSPAWIVCPYDRSVLPAEIVEHAELTHPELVEPGGVRQSTAYLAPERLLDVLHDGDEVSPPPRAARTELRGTDLRAVRRFVAAEGRAAGLAGDRIDELLLASGELAANAMRYGRPPIAVYVWRDGEELVCQVEDSGGGFADRLTGYATPPLAANSGRGLWIVRQLCDCVDILRHEGRFAVRVRLRLARTAVRAAF